MSEDHIGVQINGVLYVKFEDAKKLREGWDKADAEIEKLRAALQSVLNACDQGRMLERGAGGMTIDAQISRSFYYGVPAWPIEEARAALGEKE